MWNLSGSHLSIYSRDTLTAKIVLKNTKMHPDKNIFAYETQNSPVKENFVAFNCTCLSDTVHEKMNMRRCRLLNPFLTFVRYSIEAENLKIPLVPFMLKICGTRGIQVGKVVHPGAIFNLFTHLQRPDKLKSSTCQ